jgi:hypothetical protein
VPLSYRRDGKRYDVLVRLAGVHGQEELLEKAAGRLPAEPMPIPKPNDQPRPGEKPKGKPPKPLPVRAAPPLPEIVKKHFAEKRGYANYYFNTLHQQRVWKAGVAGANPEGAKGPWTLAGRLPQGGEYRFTVDDGSASLKLPGGETRWTAEGEWSASLLPVHSGGLLPALYLWRRLAVEGFARFGEVHYYGTAPLAGHEGLVDVLVGLHKGVECRFYFDPAEGRLLALEMFPNEESDPCEVYFSDYHETAGRLWPGQIKVRHGDERFAVFKVTEARLEK